VCPVASRATAAITSLRLTLADLVRAHGAAYRRAHRLARVQTLALRAIAESGYTGYVSHEFGPKGEPLAAMKAAYDLCNVTV
jgi:hydroxypyruvate isomerase